MSKMDRILNSKIDKQSIYEIYRACRLCGAGAGYKMPIIQTVVDIDDTDVELKQKIRECVQIEVHQDDKMPPLICELCVDKVNDFYEFFDMCRQTNKRTRLRLGLPPQSMPKGTPDAGECILGLTEPVFVNDDSDGEPLAKHKKLQPKAKVKREPELQVKIEKSVLTDTRSSRLKSSRRSPTPPRITRHSKHPKDNNLSRSRLQDKSKSPKVTPKSILKKENKVEDNSLLTPRLKRSRDKEPVKLETPVKKVKIAVKSPPPTPKSSPRIARVVKSAKVSPKRAPSPPPRTFKCNICGEAKQTSQAVGNHMRTHVVTITSPKLACNPCGLWFTSVEEASAHHKHHRIKSKPYNCRRCTADFRHLSAYEQHFENNECIPYDEVPDFKCDECWHLFATTKLLKDHRCLGEEHRPGGKCCKCNRSYALLKNLRKHEQTCNAKKKVSSSELSVDPVLLSKLRPIQIRVSRCDPLLSNVKREHYDVSNITAVYGIDRNCFYPYISPVSIKSEPNFDGMVAIEDDIKEEFCTKDYVHWDSEESDSDDDSRKLSPFAKKRRVDSLATLTLKTIFSQRCLGKVPRKRRRVKHEKSVFDSLLGNDSDDKVTRDINNIIDHLGDDDEKDELDGDDKVSGKNKSDGKENNDDKIIIFDDIEEKTTDFDDRSSQNGGDNIVDSNDMVDNDAQIKKTDNGNDKSVNNDVSVPEICDHTEKNNTAKIDRNDITSSDIVSIAQSETPGAVKEKDLNGPSIDLCDNKTPNLDEKDIKSKNVCMSVNDNGRSNSDKLNVDNVKLNNGSINVSDVVNENCKDGHSKVKEVGNSVNDLERAVDGVDNSVKETGKTNNLLENKVESKVQDENDENDTESRTIDVKNDIDDSIDNSQDSNSVGTFNESLLNDNTQSDVISEKEIEKDFNAKCVNDNATSMSELNSETDEVKSPFFIENLSQDSKISDVDINLNIDSKTNDSTPKNDSNNSVDNEKTVEKISRNSTDTEEMDDSKLMEALDAQIGDTNDTQRPNTGETDNYNDKIALEDLISEKNPVKPIDIDILPDEFNFDA